MSCLRKLLPWRRVDTPIKFECDDVLYAIYPFYQLCKFSVLCPLSIQKINGNIRLRFSIKLLIYSVFALIVYTVGFIHGAGVLLKESSRVPTIISHFSGWAQIYSLFSLAFIDIVWSWITVLKLIRLIEQIQIIDSTMACKLSIKTAYNRHLTKLYIQIILLASVPFCLSMVNCIILYERSFKFSSCFWFICFAPILVITLKQFQFYNFMLLLKSKIVVVNTVLRNMDDKQLNKMESATSIDSEKVCLTQSGRAEDKLCEKLKDIAGLNEEAITATKMVLELFSVHLFLITTTALGVITVQIYNFYALIIDYLYMDAFSIIATVAWIILQFGTVMINVCVCNGVAEEMSNTGPLLHNIQCLSDNRFVFQTAQMFSLQILHRNVNFTAAGFFNLDYKLITSIVAAVTTYLVIIIQFHIANSQTMNVNVMENRLNATNTN